MLQPYQLFLNKNFISNSPETVYNQVRGERMILYYGRRHGLLYWLFIGWWLWLVLLPFKIIWAVLKVFPKICIKVGLYALMIGGGIFLITLCGGWLAIALIIGLGYGIIKAITMKRVT